MTFQTHLDHIEATTAKTPHAAAVVCAVQRGGHFMADLPVAADAGIRPYVYVDDLDAALRRVAEFGGAVVENPAPEGDLWVATFQVPCGQRARRLATDQSSESPLCPDHARGDGRILRREHTDKRCPGEGPDS